MLLPRILYKTIHNNSYLLFGIILGICTYHYFNDVSCKGNIKRSSSDEYASIVRGSELNYKTTLNTQKSRLTKKILATKRQVDNKLIRPRYYSTELGIREKLFAGVLTSEEKINSQAIYINKTIGHLVDKLKFFISVHNKMKTTFNLTGIVGFTDTRVKYRPFQIIKYISDTFIQDYDYYFLMNDFNYLNIRILKKIVERISVKHDVYFGNLAGDSSFCNLDAGIVFSNSVIRAMNRNLEWCTANAVSDDSSENLGRCVYQSTRLECQTVVQNQTLPTYKLKHFELEKHLDKISKQDDFNKAISIYPIFQARDFYLLNAYFAKRQLVNLKKEIQVLSENLEGSWPLGQKTPVRPATRFDLPLQFYFNTTHMFFSDDFTNMRKHTDVDYRDIQKIINAVKEKVLYENSNHLQYRRLVNGYRSFDLSRGMDYMLDIGFRDLHTGKEIIKRFEVCKPLGKVEFVPAPYVTENARMTILLPIQEAEIDSGLTFMNDYNKTILQHREKTLLMLELIYQYNSASKGTADVFYKVKQAALKLSNKYLNEENKIIWVSIRLPSSSRPITIEEHKVLNIALIDLALKKIGLDSIVLLVDVHAKFNIEFLNRVKMNTIVNFQIFSPIPFRQYDPKVTGLHSIELSKNGGHFDREEYRYISFYGRDYVFVRKRAKEVVPIVRSDNDILQVIKSTHSGNVFELFLKYSDDLHCMRATEKDLKIKYYFLNETGRNNLFFGTKIHLAKILLKYQDKIGFTF